MTNRNHPTESATELPTPLSVLYSVVEDAEKTASGPPPRVCH